MTKITEQGNIRSILPSDGDPLRDRIEFFRKSVKQEHQIECVLTLRKVEKDPGNPLDRPDAGLFTKLISRFINNIRSLTE